MPRPTLTELIREAERSITILEEQIKGIDACRESDKRFAEDLKTAGEASNRLAIDLATVREKVGALEKAVDQITQRRWTLVVAIVSAALGGAFTLVIQLSLRVLAK
jgi:hypothetical protein